MRKGRQRREHTKHANRHTAGGQGWFSMVVVRADVVSQVGGATGHPEGGGTEEARAERACVRKSWRGGKVCGMKGWVERVGGSGGVIGCY